MKNTITRALVLISAPLLLSGVAVAVEKVPETPSADPIATCARMMKDSGVTEDGKKAMRDFMQSPRGSEAMTNMMSMARRMGNGDVMLGMTRMMEMMGSMGGGGMMGGQGGMKQPDAPGK